MNHYIGRESEWTPGDGDGQGGLACCDSWGRKELDTTERLIWSDLILYTYNLYNIVHQLYFNFLKKDKNTALFPAELTMISDSFYSHMGVGTRSRTFCPPCAKILQSSRTCSLPSNFCMFNTTFCHSYSSLIWIHRNDASAGVFKINNGRPSLVVKNLPANAENAEFSSWVRKIPWRREWQPTPVFLPGKSHGQRSLMGYSPWGHKELDMTVASKPPCKTK